MANIDIASLPAAISLTGAELIPIVQGGVTERCTASQLATLIQGTIGSFLQYIAPSGVINNAVPSGFGINIGRLWVTMPAGAATMNGLFPGNDTQLLAITNADAVNTLTLNALNGGSSAAYQFYGAANYAVPPGNTVLCCYYGGTTGVNKWVIL
jgi:hypothetical protein